jgi:hypothetical protein
VIDGAMLVRSGRRNANQEIGVPSDDVARCMMSADGVQNPGEKVPIVARGHIGEGDVRGGGKTNAGARYLIEARQFTRGR